MMANSLFRWPTQTSAPRSRRGSADLRWPLVAWALILVFNFFLTPGFFHIEMKSGHFYGSLIDIFDRASPTMLISLGMTLVIATGGVDLSVGAVTAISGAFAAVLFQTGEYSIFTVIALALLGGLACGLWNALLVAFLDVQPIVATLVLMVAGRGIAQLLTGGMILPIENSSFQTIGGGHVFGLPVALLIVAGGTLAISLLTRKTALGLFMEAVGNNPVASRYAGLNTRAVKSFAYAIAGLFAAVAGLIIASDISAADANNSGLFLELDAILAVVVGGTALTGGRFSLAGALIGALLIQTLSTTINTRGVPAELTLVIKAAVVLSVCLLRSPQFTRFFGRRKGIL